ncbi:hypothetical protein HAD_10370 [Hyphomonas adhaerens MHS-3]|uniref:Uncharacterized protein n=1 Tax=Hyphomonas adhaerens MHS-3 TaxID=1280949 RepID=A0A069E721_9PROT|nr:hypothetical protein [Hyphomonas adhaerens]KCZ86085.1 hypothetical protein HAD_10370 [Hyphomonas adhaerens MHS-3]
MPNKKRSKILKLLKAVYSYDNTDYEMKYSGEIGYKTDGISPADAELLRQHNLEPNNFQTFSHDDLVRAFLKLRETTPLTLETSSRYYIRGLSGDHPRYRQTLMSYLFMAGLEDHAFTPSQRHVNCDGCGLPQQTVFDRTHALYTYYLGHSWNETPAHFLPELEEASDWEAPEVTTVQVEKLSSLLQAISDASEDETPGQLEKRIASLKLLPKTDKYKRYGILQTLAVAGILPSDHDTDGQPARSDIVHPLAGWRGGMGVDYDVASKVFPDLAD